MVPAVELFKLTVGSVEVRRDSCDFSFNFGKKKVFIEVVEFKKGLALDNFKVREIAPEAAGDTMLKGNLVLLMRGSGKEQSGDSDTG